MFFGTNLFDYSEFFYKFPVLFILKLCLVPTPIASLSFSLKS